jgi:hypothetical protein
MHLSIKEYFVIQQSSESVDVLKGTGFGTYIKLAKSMQTLALDRMPGFLGSLFRASLAIKPCSSPKGVGGPEIRLMLLPDATIANARIHAGCWSFDVRGFCIQNASKNQN